MQRLWGTTKSFNRKLTNSWRIALYSFISCLGIFFGGTLNLWAQAAPAAESKPAAAAPGTTAPAQSAHPDLSSSELRPKTDEKWSTPSLEGSNLPMGDALVGAIDRHSPIFTRELVRVQWRAADPVDLYIIKPNGVKKPPVVLYLYSYPFETDRFLKDDFAAFLTKSGFAAVGFPSALTSTRYRGNRPMKEWFVSELQESLATTAHDVQMILNYLATRGDLDMDRVGMFGDGSGAAIAILAAAVDPRIKTLDLLDPWGDWPDWIKKSPLIPEKERPDYLKPEFLAKVAPLDPVKWLPQLKTQKVRLQVVKTVAVTPAEAKQKIEAAAPANVKIVHFDTVSEFKASTAGGTGFDWIKEQLQPGSTRSQQAAGGVGEPPAASAKQLQ
jgi:hypothetical protein